MCIKNTHLKCLKSYYRNSRVKVTHLFLECINSTLSKKTLITLFSLKFQYPFLKFIIVLEIN